MNEIPKKKCVHCNEEKYIFEFYRDKRNHSRPMRRCKACTHKLRKPTDIERMRKNYEEGPVDW